MKRQITRKLINWKRATPRKPLILNGVRQSGKTYALEHFGATEFRQCVSVNFEQDPNLISLFEGDLDPAKLVESLSFHLDIDINTQQDLLILDEIQACPRALTSLKYFHEKMPELAVCAAGSLLGVHLAPTSFPVGKVTFLDLYPLNFLEFLTAIGDSRSVNYLETCSTSTETPELIHQHIWERLKWYFIVGGLPEAVSTFAEHQSNLYEAFNAVRQKQADLIKAYYADIAKHSGKTNALHIDRLWRSIPIQLAKAHDGSTKKFQFKGIISGIDRYQRLANVIDWLTAANLIIKVPIVNNADLPLSAYTKESAFKLYVFDVGILGALSELPPKTILDYKYGTYKGYYAENYVAQAFQETARDTLYSWQANRAEIEFLRLIEDAIIPVEVKSGKITRAKSLQIYCEKYKPPYRAILCGKPLNISKENETHQYPLYLASQFPLKDTS